MKRADFVWRRAFSANQHIPITARDEKTWGNLYLNDFEIQVNDFEILPKKQPVTTSSSPNQVENVSKVVLISAADL